MSEMKQGLKRWGEERLDFGVDNWPEEQLRKQFKWLQEDHRDLIRRYHEVCAQRGVKPYPNKAIKDELSTCKRSLQVAEGKITRAIEVTHEYLVYSHHGAVSCIYRIRGILEDRT